MIPTIARHGGAVNPAPLVDRTASRPARWTVQIARLSRGPGSGTVAGHVLAWSRHGKESDTSVGRKDAAAKVLDTLGEPIRRNRIYEDVMERIQRLVADGHMQPGDRLPSERDLSAALHVRRGSAAAPTYARRTPAPWSSRWPWCWRSTHRHCANSSRCGVCSSLPSRTWPLSAPRRLILP